MSDTFQTMTFWVAFHACYVLWRAFGVEILVLSLSFSPPSPHEVSCTRLGFTFCVWHGSTLWITFPTFSDMLWGRKLSSFFSERVKSVFLYSKHLIRIVFFGIFFYKSLFGNLSNGDCSFFFFLCHKVSPHHVGVGLEKLGFGPSFCGVKECGPPTFFFKGCGPCHRCCTLPC